jgi:hypothetical protein
LQEGVYPFSQHAFWKCKCDEGSRIAVFEELNFFGFDLNLHSNQLAFADLLNLNARFGSIYGQFIATIASKGNSLYLISNKALNFFVFSNEAYPDHIICNLIDLEYDLISTFFRNVVAAVELIEFISVVVFLCYFFAFDYIVT